MIQFKNRYARVFESSLFQTTSTVVYTDDLILVADPNWLPSEINEIREFVRLLTTEDPDKSVYLLFTHSDYDHVLGYRAFTEAKTIASKAFAENSNKEAILKQISDWDDEYYILRDYPITYPAVDIIIAKDGEEMIPGTQGNTRLFFYQAPGHNIDGMITIVESLEKTTGKQFSIMLAGDYLSNVEIPFIDYDSSLYEATLVKIMDILSRHPINMMVPGHGNIAFTTTEIKKRVELSMSYIRELRSSISFDEPFDIQAWLKLYDFPVSLIKAHEKNVAQIKTELRAQASK